MSIEYATHDLERRADHMDWDAYAEYYDSMCEVNPSYAENIELLLKYIGDWNLPENAEICDVGAGTGNYICALHSRLPDANYMHIDFDHVMNEHAQRKYAEKNIAVTVVEDYLQTIELAEDRFDLIVCVNALYAISPQIDQLRKLRSWLKPNGKLFIIDFGRRMEVLDWAIYIFRNSVKERGLKRTIQWYKDNYEVIKQNRQGSKAQDSGTYWLHETVQFGEILESCGFVVEELFPCYRSCSDLAVCSKAPARAP